MSDWLRGEVASVVKDYDAYVPAYGTVFVDGAPEDINEPWLLDSIFARRSTRRSLTGAR